MQTIVSNEMNVPVNSEPIPSLPNGMPQLDDAVVKDLVQFFKLFSDETRLRILHFLMHEEELNVRTLCEMLKQSQPAVSHHLALLRVAGLIDCRRDGKHNFYRLISSRIKELIQVVFSSGPDQPGRLRFDDFSLSFMPGGEANSTATE